MFLSSIYKLVPSEKKNAADNLENMFEKNNQILHDLTLYQNDKYLCWSKLKAFADDERNVTQELKFI